MTLSQLAPRALSRIPGGDLVVCVDDEPEILAALAREFRNEPFDVMTTESPGQALEWVETLDVGVLLSDQRMPAMPGTEFLAEVRRRSPLTRRVILTAFPWSALSDPGALDCVQDLVCKPWAGDPLRRMVRRLLRERNGEEGRLA